MVYYKIRGYYSGHYASFWFFPKYETKAMDNVQNYNIVYILRVFENRVPRRLFGPKRDEMTGDCEGTAF
jgi:hypothetical protein